MSNSLREEWEECCAERDRALVDLAAEKARAEKAEAEYRKTTLFYNCGAEPPCEKCITCQWDDAREALAAARRECEGLRNEIAAWMLDRADQYETDDPIWVGIADLAQGVVRGDAQTAAKHGELDADLYSRLGVAAPAAGEEGKCGWSGYMDNNRAGRCVLSAGHACPHQLEESDWEDDPDDRPAIGEERP